MREVCDFWFDLEARFRALLASAATVSSPHGFDLLGQWRAQTKTDVKTVQSMLRHADIGTTLDIYTHAINKDRLVAQNQIMEAMMKPVVVN